jgi:ribonuclease HI
VQMVADFVVDHMITDDRATCLVEMVSWKLFFDGFVCKRGWEARCVMVSHSGICYELFVRLEFACTNNQAGYMGLLHWLEFLREMGAKEVEALGDSSIVVQQVRGERQCWDGVLNSYHDKCLELIRSLETFHISYIPREKNKRANALSQQASGYVVKKGLFMIEEKLIIVLVDTDHGESVSVTPTTEMASDARLIVQQDLGARWPKVQEKWVSVGQSHQAKRIVMQRCVDRS